MLSDTGVKEITLLGQNVNSYADTTERPRKDSLQTPNFGTSASTASLDKDLDPFEAHYARGFRSVYRPRRDGAVSFAELLDRVAAVDPEIRIRFTSPHPKDFSDEVLAVIASRPNVCKQLHMPAQSGSTAVLQRMRRGYTREAYDALVDHVRASIPGVALSTDMIAGFCGETEADHAASVDLLQSVRYESAFLFAYSERDRTHAARHHADDVPPEAKSRRLQELVAAYREQLVGLGHAEVGRRHLVLVEGASRRSPDALTGRTDTFKRVVFDDVAVPSTYQAHAHALHAGHGTAVGGACGEGMHGHGHGPDSHAVHAGYVRLQPGDYVAVQVVEGGGGTLRAVPLARTTLMEFVSAHGTAVPLEVFPSVQSRGDLGYPLAASAP